MRRTLVIAITSSVAVMSGGVAVMAQGDGTGSLPNLMLEARGLDQAPKRAVGTIGQSGTRLRVVEQGDQRCALDDAQFTTCQTEATIDRGQAIATSLCQPGLAPDQMRIIGLVPRGTKSVIVTYTDGTRYEAQVLGGAFALDGPAPRVTRSLPDAVLFAGDRTVTGRVPTSPVMMEMDCE